MFLFAPKDSGEKDDRPEFRSAQFSIAVSSGKSLREEDDGKNDIITLMQNYSVKRSDRVSQAKVSLV